MLKIWEERNKNEKVMIVFIVIMLVVIAINWKKVSKGLDKGLGKIKIEQSK